MESPSEQHKNEEAHNSTAKSRSTSVPQNPVPGWCSWPHSIDTQKPEDFVVYKVLLLEADYRYFVFWTLPLEVAYYFFIPLLVIGILALRRFWFLPFFPACWWVIYEGWYNFGRATWSCVHISRHFWPSHSWRTRYEAGRQRWRRLSIFVSNNEKAVDASTYLEPVPDILTHHEWRVQIRLIVNRESRVVNGTTVDGNPQGSNRHPDGGIGGGKEVNAEVLRCNIVLSHLLDAAIALQQMQQMQYRELGS
ncbi:hypothetical protein GN244_ATG01608 [Phytophthora infestans]|uniref:Transmembrane protein n=1 Tax=Phytophthora infestans TaxID=4787 RepID=A0A833SCV1_PHYIN|nr:hypothetical protein GN244_ATG01608 [Phytophthora infestans]KAF4131886.1 hypothetical protein GN958_ATG18919 [Phytophthora infestans]